MPGFLKLRLAKQASSKVKTGKPKGKKAEKLHKSTVKSAARKAGF